MQDATHAELHEEPTIAVEEMAAGRLGVTEATRLLAIAELASRSHADHLMDATLAALEPPRGAGAITALLDAKAAYDRRTTR